jgi:hypothetical protein
MEDSLSHSNERQDNENEKVELKGYEATNYQSKDDIFLA